MKIVAKVAKLRRALELLAPMIPERATRPILRGVLIGAGQDRVTAMATDLEIALALDLQDVQVEEAGAIVIDHGRLSAILRETSDESISLRSEREGLRVVLTGSDAEFCLPTDKPEDFPEMEAFPEKGAFTIRAADLATLLARTGMAVARSRHRYAPQGLHVEFRRDRIRAVGTDGKRLALMDLPSERTGEDVELLVPPEALRAILDAAGEGATIELASVIESVPRTRLYARAPGVAAVCTQLEGNFPPYENAIPTGEGVRVELPREALRNALRKLGGLEHGSDAVELAIAGGTLTVRSAADDGYGEGWMEIPLPGCESEVKVALNRDLLMDGVAAATGGTLDAEFHGQDHAVALRDPACPGWLYLLMPITPDVRAV